MLLAESHQGTILTWEPKPWGGKPRFHRTRTAPFEPWLATTRPRIRTPSLRSHMTRAPITFRIHLTGNLDDRLVAVLFELALTEGSHRAGQLGFRHLRPATASCRIRASDEP